EILGKSGQCLIEGMHPDGEPYGWENGFNPFLDGVDSLPGVDSATLSLFFAECEKIALARGYEIIESSHARNAFAGEGAKEIAAEGDAPSLDAAVAALNALPNTKGRARWIKIAFAFKGAAGTNGWPAFWDWAKSYPSATVENVEYTWNSINSSTIGWEVLAGVARTENPDYESPISADEFPPIDMTAAEQEEAARHKRPGSKEDKRPIIYVKAEHIPAVITETEKAMMAAELGLYQRGGLIVRPAWSDEPLAGQKSVKAKRIIPVSPYDMMEHMDKAAILQHFVGKNWKCIHASKDMADRYLSRVGMWKLPTLLGVISAPTLRADGSILQTPGYDETTRLIYEPDGVEFPVIPENPTREDALRALAVLAEPIAKFPFVNETARSAMLAAMLTACARRSLPHAPAFALDAPAQGSGKGKLQSILAALAEGHVAIPLSAANPIELEKRIDSALIRGAPIISIDNIIEPIDSARLATVLTEAMVECRLLGFSRSVMTPTGMLTTLTGNNLTILSELGRRTIRIRIDARMEKPWDRQFSFDPVDMVIKQRARFVAAALTILRAYHVAGRPKPEGTLGSFEVWYGWIVGALAWLGCANAKDTIEVADDPKLIAHGAVVQAWGEVFGVGVPLTTKELCQGHPDNRSEREAFDDGPEVEQARQRLRDALADATGAKGGKLDTGVVGYWLRAYKDRPSDGRCIATATVSRGERRWQLKTMAA
ncbi:MAG: hypothetical protein ACLQJR_34630, partial [Stellaceae bacterium]